MDHSEVKHLPKVDHTPAELDAASKILLKAAAVIEERGLAKGERCNAKGAMCVHGAIAFAAHGDPHAWEQDDGRLAVTRMVEAVDPGCGGAAQWNNARERTKDEVVAKLRAVALGL